MNNILSSGRLYISQSKLPNAGRGVFSTVDIKVGELIERCPVIEIPEHDAANINKTMLVTYIYYLGEKKDRMILTLGFGSIYNHTYRPNAIYKENLEDQVIDFIAIKEIKKDEEITVNYNQNTPKETDPLWFEESAPITGNPEKNT